MRHPFTLCLVLPLLLCLVARSFAAPATVGPSENVVLTNQAYNDLQTVQNVGVVLANYPGTTIGSRVPMSSSDFAVAIARLWTLLNLQTPPMSATVVTLRQDTETRLKNHPLALAALKRLVNEFQPELTAQGQDVSAIQAHLAALRPDLRPLPISPPFRDVPRSHWAFQAVENLRRIGILTGGSEGRFHGGE